MTEGSQAWRHRAVWLIIVMGGFALRLYRLGAQSLWYDETVSAYLASQSIPGLVAHTAGDIHPPGYYGLLHLWVRLAGDSEYALTFFSLVFGVLLIALSFALARRLLGQTAALWSALLVATSPYNVWYSQEVRMYTLGALLGLVTLWCALEIANQRIGKSANTCTARKCKCQQIYGSMNRRCAVGYVLAAALGLYVLYYFAFLLVALNLFFIGYLAMSRRFRALRGWLLIQIAVLALYLPWLPIAWRQATDPPVPPWRGFVPLHTVALEAWTALSLGQSVQPGQVWPLLLLVGVLFLLGLKSLISNLQPPTSNSQPPTSNLQLPTSTLHPPILLITYTFGSLALIYLASLITPLYHVRYLFTYSPPFYMLLGAGLAWLSRHTRLAAAVAGLALLGGSAFSVHQLHTNPRYAADDFRAAVRFIAERWRPGDAILINAGYAYTGFVYYYDGPIAGRLRLTDYPSASDAYPADRPLLLQTGVGGGGDPDLGWGDPHSDFYAATQAETAAALGRVMQTFPRLWVLRIYDTVTDPNGFIRDWLATNAVPFEDQLFTGESSMRVQGFMSPVQPPPPGGVETPLESGMSLVGWQSPPTVPAGGPLDVVLWWQADAPPAANYAVSLKLWGVEGQGAGAETYLVAQQDEWPVGSLLFTSAWPPGRPIRHPMRLTLPAALPPRQYWLNVEMYDPATVQPLLRRDGQGQTIPLGPVMVASNR